VAVHLLKTSGAILISEKDKIAGIVTKTDLL
jgi:predicted transcriptional regulator